MNLLLTRRNIFFLFLTLFTAVSIFYLFNHFKLSISGSPTERFLILYSLFDLFLCELFVLLLAAQILINRNIFCRAILYTLSSLFISIYYLQIISVNNGQEFLSRLAIENSDHIYLFFNYKNLLYLCLIVFTCILLIFITEKTPAPHRFSTNFLNITSLLLVGAVVTTVSSDFLLPDKIIKSRDRYLSAINLDHTSPIFSLYSVLYLQDVRYSNPLLHTDFKKYELQEINKFGFSYDPTKEYPLIKQAIYSEPPPFPKIPEKNGIKPNIIVIFSEGLSARAISTYNSKYPDLTPSIDDFAQSSMVVRRYYNHTAATYRGLLGQLCSLFPVYGGPGGWQSNYNEVAGNRYLSLADLFNRQGYETIFLDSHHQKHPSRVDEMMSRLGFGTVITGDKLAGKYLENGKPLGTMAYSDQQYFNFAIGYLIERAASGYNDKPFFMSLYNFGTHAFLKNSKDGVRYGSGKNNVLNNFHNFDYAFGQFWDYLKSSPYFHNTIIIFTADHCHYQEKFFVTAFEEPDYQKIFIDRIPLIIHDPLRKLPTEYDAGYSSSIDFAPTIAHYLGLENSRNPFMGTSIFERHLKKYRNISVSSPGPSEYFLIDENGIVKAGETGKHHDTLNILNDYINLVRELEMTDKIWDENFGP